ncbi:hypothetical protein NL676_032626 [Syzygium grande]|nr:hypothetical protein NL676_032626 [Syzygium grande]
MPIWRIKPAITLKAAAVSSKAIYFSFSNFSLSGIGLSLFTILSSSICCRYVEGPDDDNVSVTDLVHLEEQLDAAIVQTRHSKVSSLIFLNKRKFNPSSLRHNIFEFYEIAIQCECC